MIPQTHFNRYRFLLASFPVSGPIIDASQADYELEAMLLRHDAAGARRNGDCGESARLYALAKRFEKVARRKACGLSQNPTPQTDAG